MLQLPREPRFLTSAIHSDAGIVGCTTSLLHRAPKLNSEWKSDPPVLVPQMTFPLRVSTCRWRDHDAHNGSVETYADLNLKREIDAGKLPGHTGRDWPYLEGAESYFIQCPLTSPEDARQLVEYWADRGVTSFKAYMNITRAELKAAIEAAHKRGIKSRGTYARSPTKKRRN